MNCKRLFALTIFLGVLPELNIGRTVSKSQQSSYWLEREKLMKNDLNKMLGGDLKLSKEEEIVNLLLTEIKIEEMNTAFNTLNFPPSRSFFKSRVTIDQSSTLQFIRSMPKGTALHLHDMAMASMEWIIEEITYWNDLYTCNTTQDYLLFKFFDKPDKSCQWELVSEVRKKFSSPNHYDEYLFHKLSLFEKGRRGVYNDINAVWKDFRDIFLSLSGLLMYVDAWKSYLQQSLKEFLLDGVIYLEFRGILPLLYEKNGSLYSPDQTIDVYKSVIKNFTESNQPFFGAKFIYAPPRSVNIKEVEQYVKLASHLRDNHPSFVAGFDLVGQEDKGKPLKTFVEAILELRTRKNPVSLFFHAGETNWEGLSTDENLFDAILMNTSRIGHGYAIVKHPELLQKLKERDIPIEICPISNQVLMLVKDLRNHPGSILVSNSYPVVISSDDPGLWGALPLSHDFYEAFMGLGGAKADLRFLKKLALNSIRYSSLNFKQKTLLKHTWQKEWDIFIHSHIRKLNSTIDNPAKEYTSESYFLTDEYYFNETKYIP